MLVVGGLGELFQSGELQEGVDSSFPHLAGNYSNVAFPTKTLFLHSASID